MNLQSEISEVRSLMREPYRSTDADANILNVECARWIYQGELATFNALCDQALYSMAVDSSAITLSGAEGIVSGTNATVNWNRVLGVYATKSGLSVRANIVSAREFYAARHNTLKPQAQEPPLVTIEGQSVRMANSPDSSTTDVVVKYLPVPTQRAKFYAGTTDGAGSTTAIHDTVAAGIYSTAGWFTGCNIMMRSGAAAFTERAVTGWVASDYTVASLGATSGSGNTYDVGEVSTLPAQYYPVWVCYAAFLGAIKKRPELAGMLQAQFQSMVSSINARYAGGSPVRGGVLNELEA